MASILTTKAKIRFAKTFLEHFESSALKNVYFFIGKSDSWPVEISPETTSDSVFADYERRQDMLALKKIPETDVSHVIPRRNWDASGDTIYVEFDDRDTELFDHPTEAEVQAAAIDGTYSVGGFYVMTDEDNIYMCISNNNGAKSVNKPSGRYTNIITTADGYRWKYMFTITSSDALKFVTPNWLPAKTLSSDDSSNQWDVQENAVDGSIEHIRVTDSGTGYANVLTAHTLASGTTSTVVFQNSASAVNDIYNGCMVFIDSGTGAGQYREITGYVGSTRTATVAPNFDTSPDGTSIVSVLPKVTVGGNGTGCIGKAIVVGGEISRIDIVEKGSGYKTAIASISGAGGAGATISPILSPKGGFGKDAVDQLGGHFTMVNVKIDFEEDDFPRNNDYRRVGLIKNAVNLSDSVIASASTRSATPVYTLETVNGKFALDEIVQSNASGNPEAKIVEYISLTETTGTMRVFQTLETGFGEIVAGNLLTGQTSGATAIVQSIVPREVDLYEGEILYVDNRRPAMRQQDLLEDIKLVIEH